MNVQQIRKATRHTSALFIIKDETGRVIGMLEKYRDSRTDKHPWKAYIGHGEDARFLGAFYSGKNDAAQAVASR